MANTASQETPGKLAAALAAGDHVRAMELLIDGHGEHIYQYCRRMLGNRPDGDDVAQTVFMQAFSGLASLHDVEAARGWLFTIARHRCLDRLRSARRGPSLMGSEDIEALADAGAVAPTDEDPRVRRALDDCLDELDEQSRALLVLRFHDELSYDEISKLVAVTPGALRVRVSRALPALRDCMESKGVTP
ncbi:MAG TPA: RNA polymerase sigma factor [Kofleriaceae bacterium]|nr:RNA polymerase sigma factor [Kofleriaceae bacterium]